FIEFECERSLLLRPRGLAVAGLRPPPIVKHKNGVVAPSKVFVDNILRSSHATKRVFPAYRCENNAVRFPVIVIETHQRVTKGSSFCLQPAWRANKNPVLNELAWHKSLSIGNSVLIYRKLRLIKICTADAILARPKAPLNSISTRFGNGT